MTRIESVIKYLTKKAKKHKTESEYWIHGWDEGLSYCYDCAVKKLTELKKEDPSNEELLVDGGWEQESDHQDFCETCGVQLVVSLTDYGVESELDHFEENGFDLSSEGESYDLLAVLESCPDSQELKDRIDKLAQRIKEKVKS